MKQKTILVVGGAGFIGSHVNQMLYQTGYQTIVLDNLSQGNRQAVLNGIFIEGDIADTEKLHQLFNTYPIDAVMHFAALTDVGESVINPLKYYINNVSNTLNLLNVMLQHSVKIFIFSSTAAIFGIPQTPFIAEDHPCNPVNPYGTSKLMVENILQDCDYAYGLRSCSLRYFNAAGGDPHGKIKYYKRKESNLIPLVLRSLKDPTAAVTIYGTDYPTSDGTCIRDYIHIEDLGSAHITAMEQLFNGAPTNQYNLGNGKGFTVREVIETASKVTGKTVRAIEGPRRAGDPPFLLASAQKAQKELNWIPRYPDLDTMLAHAWQAMH